jgi:hypothetical protein
MESPGSYHAAFDGYIDSATVSGAWLPAHWPRSSGYHTRATLWGGEGEGRNRTGDTTVFSRLGVASGSARFHAKAHI